MKRIFPTLAMAVVATLAGALDVTVVQLVPARCGQSTGVLQAAVTGGVPPYSIQWSTGATTEHIVDLAPGTYSVIVTDAIGDEATANGDVLDVAVVEVAMPMAQVEHALAHCSGEFPLVELTLHAVGPWGGALYGVAPFTITGPPSVISSETLPCVDSACDQDSVIRVRMDEAAGSVQTITWSDATGCAGQSTVVLSQEVVWPAVQVYDVLGACNGTSTGQLSFTTAPDNVNYVRLRLLGPDGGQLAGTTLESDEYFTAVRGDLDPGDHLVILQPRYFGAPTDGACADTTIITIEDLGSGCGQVAGPVFVDGDADCMWESGENRVPQAIVEFTPGPYYATTTSQGFYTANLPLGTYDHQVIHPGVQQECPGPVLIDGSQPDVDGAIGCSSLVALDAYVGLGAGPARPGFQVTVAVSVTNGTLANTGPSTLMLTFDPILSYVGSYPGAPSTVNGNEVSWNFNGLGAFAQQTRWVTLQVPPDVDLIGTELMHSLSFTTGNTDDVPSNNSGTMYQLVTGSYDPNMKVARTSTGQDDEVYFIDEDAWIDYTLHFQNTGTDTAFMVVVTDTLPASLDPSSVQMGAASHAFNWSLAGAGALRFTFPNILLPDSNTNELLSHGFVSFRIRPRLPITPGTVIENVANIYFDLNPPVITEPSLLVAEFSTGVSELSGPVGPGLRPNPADQAVLLVSTPDKPGTSWRVLSLDGRVVKQGKLTGMNTEIFVGDLSDGPYVVITLDGARTTSVERFIIQHP